ncbi:uncharacterized protein [Musca autumnalis]|uniref:uncharacterized protein n=1 Tax=Musca autumnalis TaxID=221902 RepID=UPI003CED2B02
MPDYSNYINCGEILKSPSLTINEQEKFIFRCGCLDDHYIVLESFVLPPCSKRIDENKHKTANVDESNKAVNDDISIKCETNISGDGVYPLNFIKISNLHEDGEDTEIKEESPLHETEEHFSDPVDNLQDDELLSVGSDDASWENVETDNESVESEDSNSPLFVHNFIKLKENVFFLIEQYKKHSKLWNQKSPQCRLKKQHDKYLDKIKDDLKEQHNLQMSCTQIASVITYLCRKYRQHLKLMAVGIKNQPAWFFPHLEFLKPVVEKSLRPKISATTTKDCNLTSEQIIQVLGIYERFPHLWNTDIVEHVCKNKRLEAIEQMQKVIKEEMKLEISEQALQSNLQFIHNHYSKIKRCHLMEAKPKPDKYYRHMQFLSEHIGPFQCKECAQIFKSPLTFKVHRAQHDGSAAIRCSICSKEYSNPGPYIAHARRHMNDLSEECKECGKKFLVASDLKIHMRSHTGVQPYCCEICGISFRHSTSLNVHRRRHEKQYLHKCPICSKGFYKKDRMNDHIRSHNNVRDFACKICGKAFKTRKTLKQHEVIHEDVRKHVCSLCGKAFKLKVGLLQHMRTHGAQH